MALPERRPRFSRVYGWRPGQPTDLGVEVIGAVAPEEVPALPVKGQWTTLFEQVMRDYNAGQVTVLRVPSNDEYKRLRNGMSAYFTRAGVRLQATVVPDTDPKRPGSLRVYMVVKERTGATP